MPWTYEADSVVADAGYYIHRVRERIGDTDVGRQLLDDDILERELEARDNDVLGAAVVCARMALARIVRDPDRSVGGIQVTRARAELYRDLIADLEREQAGTNATMTVGGTSIAEVDTLQSNTDWRPHTFGVGFMDRDGGET